MGGLEGAAESRRDGATMEQLKVPAERPEQPGQVHFKETEAGSFARRYEIRRSSVSEGLERVERKGAED